MTYTKEIIYNLALGALLLQRQVTNTATDKSNEVKVLNIHYDIAFESALQDMDLDHTMSIVTLALIEKDPIAKWLYAYTYPTNCVFFRRIDSSSLTDSRSTHLPKRVGIHEGAKVIFANEVDAVAEIISDDFPLGALSASAGLGIALRLAVLSAPLIVGKGAKTLRQQLTARYVLVKSEAQEHDKNENFNYVDDEVSSEFVEARTS